MKKKLSFATTITRIILFLILTISETPFLFLTAFILLVSRGIMDFIDATNDTEINEDQPKDNFIKLFLMRLIMQLIPIVYTLICVYLLLKKEFI